MVCCDASADTDLPVREILVGGLADTPSSVQFGVHQPPSHASDTGLLWFCATER